jgi:hypothetical protein
LQRGEFGDTFEEAMHGSDFTGGATGYVQKRQEFVRTPTLETFGDVIRDRKGGAFQLVSQTCVATKRVVTGEGVGSPG